jgi:hypothetical protein
MSDHLSADDIEAILDDEGSDSALGHLAICADCRRLIQRQKAADARLKALMFRSECPDSGLLAELALNQSPSTTPLAPDLKDHLAICADCREDLEDLRRMLGPAVVSAAEAARPAAPLLDRWRHSPMAKPSQQSYASAHHELLVGESLAASLDATSTFVSVQRQPRGLFGMVGSVIDSDAERWIDGSVEVYIDGQFYETGPIDALGGFQFANIPLKTLYIVVADRQGKRIALPPWRFALE